jgi:AraC-like DNA-binding protein
MARQSIKLELPPASTSYRHPLTRGRVVSVYFDLQRATLFHRHRHDQLQLTVHLGNAECEVSFELNGQTSRLILMGERIYAVTPGVLHTVDWKRGAPLVVFFVEKSYLRQIGIKLTAGVTSAELADVIRNDVTIWALVEIFRGMCMTPARQPKLYVESLATVLATRLARAHFNGAPLVARNNGNLPTSLWQRVENYVATHYKEKIYDRDLARAAGLSEFYFIRQFKLVYSKTPREYVMEFRTLKAEEFILARNLAPKQAAREAGFRDPGTFYRRYRRMRGFQPRQLLKQPRA